MRRVSALLVACVILTACPAPRTVAGIVYSASTPALGGSRVMAKPLRDATVTWSCPPGTPGAPAPQTLTTEYNGRFESKAFYSDMPNECELVVSKQGHLEFREKFAGLCVEPSPHGCSRVNVAVELKSLEDAAKTAVPLDAPKTGGGDIQTVFDVVLAADGTTKVDGKAVANDDAVLVLAKDAVARNAELRAVIKADSSVPHGRVVHVLDLLKQARVTKIAFGVTPL